jgi:PAS domain S-box-containing protein
MKDNLNRLKPAILKATARYFLRKSIKERDDKLRQQESRFEDIIAAAPDALVGMNEAGNIILFNAHAETLWGYKREEVMGTSMHYLVPEWYWDQHKQTRIEFFSNPSFREVRRQPVERIGKRKNGEEFPVEVTISYYESQTEKIGIMGFRDIKQRKLIEAELENTNTQLRELAANLQSIREEERSDIAREIHDELGQQLTALKYDFSNYNKLAFNATEKGLGEGRKILDSIDNLIHTIRRISSELHPSVLDDFGLGEALAWYSREFENRSGIFCNFVNEAEGLLFEKKFSLSFFRIYQEALTNVSRHAAATSIESFLRRNNGDIILSITDNGKGLNTTDLKSKKSLGLVSMKERALSINGFLTIENNNNSPGTTVTLKAPFTQP